MASAALDVVVHLSIAFFDIQFRCRVRHLCVLWLALDVLSLEQSAISLFKELGETDDLLARFGRRASNRLILSIVCLEESSR